ncbi:BTAD domain-containing putative transcriptional regulator [Microlunatus sp. Gsoil 973]|uniref:AfsR/SARP family transcriptional regulator n=1 Tax=Microlunatus sp. Gsoil 973 TaxID=2672569 RepID=UPI0012B44B40|nr:BTAD domain-containing putative transcriptional regulator [Microlunatus sp. Gsoil 973]QGN32085.1 AAA family ATPase [Microlunatus sp. Gsoil 973]
MQIAILGPLEVTVSGRRVSLAGARLRTLLVRLAVDAPKPVSVPELIDAVWSEDPPVDATNALQSLVSRLRRAFGDPAVVVADPAGYRLALDRSAIDLHRFIESAGQAGRLQRADRPEESLSTCNAALALWRGDPLVDAAGAEYAHPVISACLSHRLGLIATRIEALLDLGRAQEVITELEEVISSHPLQEGFVAQQMRALAAAGRVSEALSGYEQFRKYLAAELGSDPGPELQRLHLALLRGDLPASAGAPTERAPMQQPTNLRPGLTSFIGRESELARIAESLTTSRLTTIVGPGGAGKTRTAAEAGRQWMGDHGQPAWMVELAPVGSPENIPGAVLGALGLGDPGLRERSERTGADELQRLLDHLSTTSCLLVIDNCEHLIDGVAAFVEDLLTLAAGVRVLATSREPLALTAEALCPLPPLQLPPRQPPTRRVEPERVAEYAAVRLWIDRASAIVPGYRLTEKDLSAVVEIVRRLDGLPLAIELAAARLRVLPVGDIARLLSDRFRLLTGGNRTSLPRHRTLRAVVEWSWDLLTGAERLLAERLAIFPAGAGIDSATAICADHRLPADQVADLMINLADKSLLEHSSDTPVRFRMLETIREYGIEQLDERGELAEARSRHADYFFDLVLDLEPQMRDHRQREARMIMDTERGNIFAALQFLIDGGDPQRALIMTLGLYWQFQVRDQESELGYWVNQVIAANDDRDEPLLVYAEALALLSDRRLLNIGDDGDHARQVMADLVARMDRAPEPPFPGLRVLREQLPIYLGAESGVSIDDLVARAASLDDPWVRGAIFAAASWMAENLGDREQMARYTAEAYQAFVLTGDAWGLSAVLSQRAQLHTLEGEDRRGRPGVGAGTGSGSGDRRRRRPVDLPPAPGRAGDAPEEPGRRPGAHRGDAPAGLELLDGAGATTALRRSRSSGPGGRGATRGGLRVRLGVAQQDRRRPVDQQVLRPRLGNGAWQRRPGRVVHRPARRPGRVRGASAGATGVDGSAPGLSGRVDHRGHADHRRVRRRHRCCRRGGRRAGTRRPAARRQHQVGRT